MIRIVDHDPAWAPMFQQAADDIVAVMLGAVVQLHHIGSTAIPRSNATPVIEMLLETPTLDALDASTRRLVDVGYEAMGEFGIKGWRYFRRDSDAGQRTHQIRARSAGSHNVLPHLAFRDYVCANSCSVLAYSVLKARLAPAHGADMRGYNARKHAFVSEHQQLALLWQAAGNARIVHDSVRAPSQLKSFHS